MAGIFIAFKKIDYVKGIFHSDWVGLRNFKFLFQTDAAWIIIRNTVLYNLVFIVVGNLLAIALAIFMSEIVNRFAAKFFQTSLLLPNLVSMVVVSYLVYALLSTENGLINKQILERIGTDGVQWYANDKYWPFILVLVYSWKTAGYSSVVYIGSIAGIDKQIFEAARIDGAGKMAQIFRITLPLLKPTIIIMVLMMVGKIFTTDFGLFYQVPMNSGALFPATQTIDTYVYRALMNSNDIAKSSAAGLFQSVLGFAFVLFANGFVRKKSPENALF